MSKLKNLNIQNISNRLEPRKVLICPPKFYDIKEAKNVHMNNNIGKINKTLANTQWNKLHAAYLRLKEKKVIDEVMIIEPLEGLEDMVFCANQTFPWVTEKQHKVVIMSKMKYASREKEIKHFEFFFENLNYKIIKLNNNSYFEGMGDVIPHPGKKLLYGGYGFRSDESSLNEIANVLDVPLIKLNLINPKFYHLDTCFMPADAENVLICKEAFNRDGLAAIRQCFKNVIPVPFAEAEQKFALNAHCLIDALNKIKIVIIQAGCAFTIKCLKGLGYEIIELDTSEFIKSGGSVFCMKMMVY